MATPTTAPAAWLWRRRCSRRALPMPDLLHIRVLDTASDGLPVHLCDERAFFVCYVRIADVKESDLSRPDICPECAQVWREEAADRARLAAAAVEWDRGEVLRSAPFG